MSRQSSNAESKINQFMYKVISDIIFKNMVAQAGGWGVVLEGNKV